MDRPLAPAVFAPARLQQDWRTLCVEIGERRAGSVQEKQAATFIARALARAGLDEVRLQPFPCTHLKGACVEVHEDRADRWEEVKAVTLVGAPGTPGGEAVEGNLVWLESPAAVERLAPRSLRRSILVLFGALPASLTAHRKLLAAEPRAVVHVDERLPFAWTKDDGVYPYWARTVGMPPTITVAYMDAWRWRRDGLRRLRVRVRVEQVEAESQNVLAELPGRDSALPAITLTAHHDTQCGNPGADDNASGVVCLLALARTLAGHRLRRTVRFISFGTEEQLSVGSSAYVAACCHGPRDTGLVLNFDSVSSPLGHFVASVAGPSSLVRFARAQFDRAGLDVALRPEITPYSDHFPFNRTGVPSLWFMRTNCPGGRWQHHSEHDTLANVSTEPVIRLLRAVHPLVRGLAAAARWPFAPRLPRDQQSAVDRLGARFFGPIRRPDGG